MELSASRLGRSTSQGKRLRYPVDRMLGWQYIRYAAGSEEKSLYLREELNPNSPVIQPVVLLLYRMSTTSS
jgi:hypothetical protein